MLLPPLFPSLQGERVPSQGSTGRATGPLPSDYV